MASPMSVFKKATPRPKFEPPKDCSGSGTISELVSKAFTTRSLLHFAHWKTGSFATHLATGDLYDQIIESIDELVECYMGRFGQLEGLSTASATVPKDIVKHVKNEMAWMEANKCSICKDVSALESLLDIVSAAYLKTIYKLENLK